MIRIDLQASVENANRLGKILMLIENPPKTGDVLNIIGIRFDCDVELFYGLIFSVVHQKQCVLIQLEVIIVRDLLNNFHGVYQRTIVFHLFMDGQVRGYCMPRAHLDPAWGFG